jgi:MFS family permease
MTHAQHKASLRYSLWDAFFFSLMIGAGETYLPAYALSVGMSEWLTGLFATVPLMAGAVLQLISPWVLVRVKSPKYWVLGAVILQALCFVPLFIFSLTSPDRFLWLFVAASLYWAAGFAAGPAWNLWMQQLVPEENVAHFFALRHRILQIGILIGLVGGGVALHSKVELGPFQNVF